MNESKKPDNAENLLDAAVEGFRRMACPDPPPIQHLLTSMNGRAASPLPVASPLPRTRRFYMRPVFRYSVAASVLVAMCGSIMLLGSFSNVALADVLDAAGKHKLVKYRMTESVETKDGSSISPLVRACYADLKAPRYRWVATFHENLMGCLDSESVYVHNNGASMAMITETVTEKGKTDPQFQAVIKNQTFPRKEVTLFKTGQGFEPATKEASKSILENLHAFEKHKDVVATKSKLDGKSVLKYRIEEEKQTTTLWVDPATNLPIRVENDRTEHIHESFNSAKVVLSDFEWDPEIKGFKSLDELFSVTPPEGYKVEDQRKKEEKKEEK